VNRPLALVGGTVVDGSGRPPIERAIIEVDGGRIINVRREADGEPAAGVQILDVNGATILPGLIDGHVHCGRLALDPYEAGDPEPNWDWWMRAFVRWGITSVRDTGSPDLGDAFVRHKRGQLAWPHYSGSGPNLDGPPGGPWPGLIVVDDEDAARTVTRQLIADGAEFIKVYVWMSPAVMRAVVQEAHAAGRKVAAHVGNVVTVEEATRLGVDAFEHVRVGPELLTVEQRAAVDALPRRPWDHLISFRPWRYAEPESPAVDRLLDLLVERDATITPTLVLSRSVLRANEPDAIRPLGIDEVPAGIRSTWVGAAENEGFTADDWKWAPVELSRQLEFIGRASARGVRIVAGTDCGSRAIPPGSSLHEELEMLVECGLSPLAAIQAATRNAAELLGLTAERGTIGKGMAADLLVVDGDPLNDITATRRIRAVIRNGTIVHGGSRDAGDDQAVGGHDAD
jgi:imidazolonepropionase-like amidohydrolase